MSLARGPFEVKLAAQSNDVVDGTTLARLTIDKLFHGDLEGVSKGEMLSVGTATKGSAGYVAVERVIGTLGRRRGSFVLQHSGTMNRGAQQLTVSVVPDSGSGELVGLSGTMKIIIGTSGKHDYEFEYTIGGS